MLEIGTLGLKRRGLEIDLTVRLVRHSQRKRGATDRLHLRSTAPALDPTVGEKLDAGIHSPLECRWDRKNLKRQVGVLRSRR